MKEHFIKLIQYEQWANDQIIESLEQCIVQDERALLLLSHLISVQTIWLNRIKNEPIITPLFEERSLQECKRLQIENINFWVKYLHSLKEENLNSSVQFEFHGQAMNISLLDAMTHFTSHASYHRGQIIARIKNELPAIPLTTYINYLLKEKK